MTELSYETAKSRTFAQAKKLPNIITGLRIVTTLPVVVAGALGYHWLALVLIVLAGISDGLDGQLARRFREETPLGVVGDPLADKFFMNFTLLGAYFLNDTHWLLALWVLAMCYDTDNTWQRWPTIRRALLNLPREGKGLSVTKLSRWKTAIMFVVIAYAYAPPALINAEVLTFGAIMSVGLVALSWWHNRRETVLSWLKS